MVQFKVQISVLFIAAAAIAPIVALPFPGEYFKNNYDPNHEKSFGLHDDGSRHVDISVGVDPKK
jgi:hypothetical protein